jgi:phosphoribosyl-ATP pyrophosphohydrolase/phosphoribosyl-AMP cyclohydrolase
MSQERTPDFSKGLIPAVVQHATSREVLMLAYMNEEAYRLTLETKKATFFSRSRNCLWVKGETSGNFLAVSSLSVDCDGDTILVKALPAGPTCHTGNDTCFDEKVGAGGAFLFALTEIIRERRRNAGAQSYTASLFASGVDRMAQKVGEEAVEVVIEAKNSDNGKFLGEASDLVFHLMVLLEQRGFSLDDVGEVLRERHTKRTA